MWFFSCIYFLYVYLAIGLSIVLSYRDVCFCVECMAVWCVQLCKSVVVFVVLECGCMYFFLFLSIYFSRSMYFFIYLSTYLYIFIYFYLFLSITIYLYLSL